MMNSLPKQTYRVQVDMEKNGKYCWASKLRDALYQFGLGSVRLQKSVGNAKAYLALLKQRLCDDFEHERTTALHSSES